MDGLRGPGRDRPYPGRVARNEAFWERDELCLVCCGLRDELTRLFYGALEVEPDGLGLGDGDVDL